MIEPEIWGMLIHLSLTSIQLLLANFGSQIVVFQRWWMDIEGPYTCIQTSIVDVEFLHTCQRLSSALGNTQL